MKELGYEQILAILQDYEELDRMLVEYDENYVRKSFTPSEAVEAKRRIEPKFKAEAKQRQKAGASRGGKKVGSIVVIGTRVRKQVADRLGYSHDTLKKAEDVVKAVEKEPTNVQLVKILDQMDKTSNVNRAYSKLVKIVPDIKKKKATRTNGFKESDPKAEWYRWQWEPIIHGEEFQLDESSLEAPDNTEVPTSKQDEPGWDHVIVKEIFHDEVPKDWITRVLEVCERNPEWSYVFATQYPERLPQFSFPENCYVGAVVSTTDKANSATEILKSVSAPRRFVELQSLDDYSFDTLDHIDWIAVSPGPAGEQPTWEEIINLENFVLTYGDSKPIYYKPSINWKQVGPSGMPELD